MEILQALMSFLSNPADVIYGWITTMGALAYAPMFAVVFIETGVVVFPFLPGDSLLFAAGVFAQGGGFSLPILIAVVCTAAIIGDQCNFAIGTLFGKRIIASGKVRALTPERIAQTHAVLEKYGAFGIFVGRFIPFVRTFVPFIAGMGGMSWKKFALWNACGGLAWGSLFTTLGCLFGGIPFVQDHFELCALAIVAISLVPLVVGVVKARFGSHEGSATTQGDAQKGAHARLTD
ncbi:MAG: VTT domain-containing protein [Eggerthellaceae bacterium]|jgi:membrane-associated protein